MPSSWLHFGIRAVNGGRIRTFGSKVCSEPTVRKYHTVLSGLLRCQPSACCLEKNGSLLDTLGDSKAVRRSSSFFPDLFPEVPKICVGTLLPGSSSEISPSIPDGQVYRTGFRSRSSVSATRETSRCLEEIGRNPGYFQEGKLDEASLEVLGRERSSSRNEDRADGVQETASGERNESQAASSVCGGYSGVELEVDCLQVLGDGPKPVVSEKKVPKLRNASKKSARSRSAEVSALTSFGEDNLKPLLAGGAKKKGQRMPSLKQHPEFDERPPPPIFMESIRLFQEFGMDRDILVRVIKQLNKWSRTNIFVHTPPHKPKQILTFLRDKIGVKNFGKAVTGNPTLLKFSLDAFTERVKGLEALGVVVDGNFVEIHGALLALSPTSLRESANALELALGPLCFMKTPWLLGVKAEKVESRVANLHAILGQPLAKESLGRYPTILLCREATVKEMWFKLGELFPGSELTTRIQRRPDILARNWKNINFKFEYLASKGFTQGEILGNLSSLTLRSLDKFIKPRVELALGKLGVSNGLINLTGILCGSQARFVQRFGVSLE